jgi:tRNA modification GTPase
LPAQQNNQPVKISALKNINIDILKDEILSRSITTENTDFVLTELRHFEAVSRATDSLKNALQNLKHATMDCIASDLLSAYDCLGEITGLVGTDDIIDEVFSKFCVGK